MKVIVRTPLGELKELEVDDEVPIEKPCLKLDVMNLEKLPYDILFLMIFYLDFEDIRALGKCSTKLNKFCMNPIVWKDIALREVNSTNPTESRATSSNLPHQRQYVQEHLRARDASLIQKSMHCHLIAKRIWDTLEAYLGRIDKKTLNTPASEYDLLFAEEQLGFVFPAQIRGSWLVHNGQTKIEHSKGFLDGCYLLPLKVITQTQKEFENNVKTKGIDPNVIHFLNGYREVSEAEAHRVVDSTRWIPLTTLVGYKQWCTETTTGAIYLFSGWNIIKKGDSWFSFLDSLLG